MLFRELDLECCGTYMDVTVYNVPNGLTVEKFEEVISFKGIVNYLRSLPLAELPLEICNDKEAFDYFNSCPMCGSGEYIANSTNNEGVSDRLSIKIKEGVMKIRVGSEKGYNFCKCNGKSNECCSEEMIDYFSIPVKCCPLCGRCVIR